MEILASWLTFFPPHEGQSACLFLRPFRFSVWKHKPPASWILHTASNSRSILISIGAGMGGGVINTKQINEEIMVLIIWTESFICTVISMRPRQHGDLKGLKNAGEGRESRTALFTSEFKVLLLSARENEDAQESILLGHNCVPKLARARHWSMQLADRG